MTDEKKIESVLKPLIEKLWITLGLDKKLSAVLETQYDEAYQMGFNAARKEVAKEILDIMFSTLIDEPSISEERELAWAMLDTKYNELRKKYEVE